ncbi:hypothetical protein Tco_0688364 [Tanacetum coccineum]
MLYCIKNNTPFNFAYFIDRRLSGLEYNNKALLYARVMTTLFEYLKNKHPNDASRMIEVDEVTPMGRRKEKRARAYGGEDKLLKLDEEKVQASSNYKAKIKTQATSTEFFIFAMGKFLVVLVELSDPRRKSNHKFLGVDSEGGILYEVAHISERRS